MSISQRFRAFLNKRLTEVTEEIAVLFEKTIVEYEEEWRRSIEEDQILKPTVILVKGKVQMSTGLDQNQEITDTLRIKDEPEEQNIKHEEEQLPMSVPESGAVCVKTEESPSLQQREPQGEIVDSETEEQTELSSDTDNDDDWNPPFSCSEAQMETETDGQHVSLQSGPERRDSVDTGDASERRRTGTKQQETFSTKQALEQHGSIHTEEKPYCCSICNKTFKRKYHLNSHRISHTEEKPYSCSICKKSFARKGTLKVHWKVHTGERPYSCSVCERKFASKLSLNNHERIHTGEKPFRCSTCGKAFRESSTCHRHERNAHRIHTKDSTRHMQAPIESDNI